MDQNPKAVGMRQLCTAIVLCGITAITSRGQGFSAERGFDYTHNSGPAADTENTVGNLGENLIVNGAFGMGDTGFVSDYIFGNDHNAGTYVIGTSPCKVVGHWYDWQCFPPHNGRQMLVANGANYESERVWSETVTVDPGTKYLVSFWAATLNTSITSPAQLVLQINDQVVGQITLPDQSPASGGIWVQLEISWPSGDNSSATLDIFDANTATDANDFVLDDISLRQLP
ncbi:MAG TPA: hypothetical protein VGZ29_06815 [Terriglobia bacterium]|nr:hypothetical protein [Terriglobia bacterium]